MSEAEMLERIQKLERNLAALQSAVVAISFGQPIKVNADGMIEAVLNPTSTGHCPMVNFAGTAWTPLR